SRVDWSAGTVRLLTRNVPWPPSGEPRRAGISSFGLSGTNAHAIIEEALTDLDAPAAPAAVPDPAVPDPAGPVPLLLSARSPESLRALAARLSTVDAEPLDVAYSLVTTRSRLPHRAVVIATDRAAARDG